MNGATDRFLSFVLMERRRHRRRLAMACLLAALIGTLLYETQGLNLRSGLVVLLTGQVGDVLALLSRNIQLSSDMDRRKSEGMNEVGFSAWFEREERFVKGLALFDSSCQMIGFLALGYAFWMSTRNLWLSVAIGFVYPVTAYFGMTRGKNLQAISQLRAKKQEVVSSSGYNS